MSVYELRDTAARALAASWLADQDQGTEDSLAGELGHIARQGWLDWISEGLDREHPPRYAGDCVAVLDHMQSMARKG